VNQPQPVDMAANCPLILSSIWKPQSHRHCEDARNNRRLAPVDPTSAPRRHDDRIAGYISSQDHWNRLDPAVIAARAQAAFVLLILTPSVAATPGV